MGAETKASPARASPFPVIAAILIGAAAGLLFSLPEHLPRWLGPAIGLSVALGLYLAFTRRERRRRRLDRAPFPDSHRAILEAKVDFYRRLGEADRRRFESELRYFLEEQRIVGPRGAEVALELKILVAASAVIVAFGRPEHRYPPLRDIVVYEEAFTEEYEVKRDGHVLGMVHAQGPILFSARALRQGFAGARDGLNVGLHEFAHVLDFEGGPADGVPSLMPWGSVDPWVALMHEETRRVRRHRSLLRSYAATNEAELFAVATEAFFERPKALRSKHPELYDCLRQTYGQDPASESGEA